MATGEKLDDFVKLGGIVNDVITGNKLQELTCYHIVLYSRHNKLAEKHSEPLPPRLVMMTLSGSYTKWIFILLYCGDDGLNFLFPCCYFSFTDDMSL